MGYKKHNWMPFGAGGTMLELALKDESNKKLDFFRTNNQKDATRISNIIYDKYGYDLSPTSKKSKKEEEKELKAEIEWLNQNDN